MKLLILLCSIAVGGVVAPAYAFTDLGNGQYQTDGSKADVQAAANAAPTGSTLLLPSGTFTWTGTVFVDRSLNIFGGPTTILNNHTPNSAFEEKGVFKLYSTAHKNVEIKNIHFGLSPSNTGPYTGICQLWFHVGADGGILLVHDCTFDTSDTVAKGLRLYQNRALIWKCTFNGSVGAYGFEDGIAIQDGADTYPAPSTWGTLDKTGTSNCYVEDSNFNNVSPGYALDVSDSARVVVRHCTFTNSYIGSHGQESSPHGMRHAEVYNCTFSINEADNFQTQAALWIRGGSWAIWGNTFGAIPGKSLIMMQVLALTGGINYLGTHVCPTHYPAPRQIGQGWVGSGGYSYPDLPQVGSGYTTEAVYIWNNSPSSPSVGFGDEEDVCGNGLKTSQFVQAGRDYFIGTAKPGYTPYPYPHPLRGGGGGPTPTPTPTPVPTPTPTPTPVPTPPPSATFERWIGQHSAADADWIRSHPPTPD